MRTRVREEGRGGEIRQLVDEPKDPSGAEENKVSDETTVAGNKEVRGKTSD